MTIEQTIQKAIEGGWDVGYDEKNGHIYTRDNFDSKGNVTGGSILSEREIFLDRLFWQALGKSLKWERVLDWYPVTDVHCVRCGEEVMGTQIAWKYYWHRFIDHLIEGKSPESFFETLNTDTRRTSL